MQQPLRLPPIVWPVVWLPSQHCDCRSGLELDIGTLRKAGGAAVRLTVCPGVAEALVVGGLAVAIFKMPIALGLTLGFILAAVSPAVVVSGMFDLQRRGFGVKKGIPSIVVAASSFDDVVAITGGQLL
jgi:solute carrier family 9B (sodium/hydrogen exchanger), member 1/2